ncbi:hypothetical protein Trydic_g1448 [Trypoxylus dichotomus]
MFILAVTNLSRVRDINHRRNIGKGVKTLPSYLCHVGSLASAASKNSKQESERAEHTLAVPDLGLTWACRHISDTQTP